MESNFKTIYRNPVFLFPYENPLNEFPFYIDVELTNACNLMCIMCSRNIMKRKQGFMAWRIFERIVEDAARFKAGIRFVRHGEPFLHRDVIEMSKYAKERNILIFISTNGLLLSQEMCQKIIDTRIDEIRFSMQGTDSAGYKEMRIGGDYGLFVNNIRLLRRERDKSGQVLPFISLSTSVMNEGEEDIEQFKEEWAGIVDSINIDITDFSYVKDLTIVKDFLAYEKIERAYKPCTEVMTKLSVNWNGDITPCCKDFDGQLIIGNIDNMSLSEAWNSNELNRLRNIVGKALNHQQIPMCSKCYQRTKKFDNIKKHLTAT